ncbi:MAG: VCBS repeat-containing protein [Phycisphaerae bacterium]|nr:VCBS repeat-containing protein [Phycisphaerae bacterium]
MKLADIFQLALMLALVPVCYGTEKDKAPKPVRDIAITNLSAPSTCKQGDTVPIIISFSNQGTRRETFSVILTEDASGKEIASKEVALAKGWKTESDAFADLIFAGESPGVQQFGNYVSSGDINNDGYDDFLTTAPYFENLKGRAYLYYGGKEMDNFPDITFTGEYEGEALGVGNCLGDINGDNYLDIILGACGYNSGHGRIHIYYGGPDMDSNPDITIIGKSTGAWFGRRIEAYDIDRDGYDDVLVVATQYNNNTGRAYLFYGGNPFDTTADVVFDGENPNDRFGRQATMGPDVNGDGYGEILIGARGWPGDKGQGRAYLYLGNTPERMDSICDIAFTGEEVGDQLGSSQCICDIDKDGFADILVGARFAANNKGRVYLYWGKEGLDGGQPDLIMEGEYQSDMGGDDIVCGNLNGDVYEDILIGAYNYPSHTTRRGRVYVFHGNTKTTIDTVYDIVFTGEKDLNRFGLNVAIGDANGDGFNDAIVGAYGYNNLQGRAYLYYGPFSNTENITFNWDTTTSPGTHTLKASIAPIAGEEDVADNTMTVTVEVKERQQ